MVGRRLAHYEIKEHLGSGGMGDVYRATDTKLGRSVALKFLRDDVTADPGRAARFGREARALAALNHPHIAAIHGQEEADGRTFLVMEFVPGQTLDERIDGRPLPLTDAISTALQIIEALEAAHDRGIVHRDLKPANIKITPDGRVKVLDFGLAKAIAGANDVRDADGRREAETVTLPSAHPGAIVGTPAYMSPEQAKGLPVDQRTDIFAFGCVFFEMLSGRRAFAGTSSADVVSRVLQHDPDWTLLPPSLPHSVERLVRLCLEKDLRKRRQAAGDVRIDLEHANSEPAPVVLPRVNRLQPLHLAGLAAVVVAIAALAAWIAVRESGTAAEGWRLPIVTPDTLEPMHFAVSPDGAYIVSAVPVSAGGTQRLYLASLKTGTARFLSGTDAGRYPFWSPDSRSIAFFADRKLLRVDIAGGAPVPLADAANPLGGTWSADGTILFAPTTVSPLLRVSARGGGAAVAATQFSMSQTNHRGPSFLPDGRRFLFYAIARAPADSGIYLGSLDGGTPKRLTAADSAAVYAAPDRILFVQEMKLVARRIDTTRGELSGDPVTVAQPVSESRYLGWFSMSATGVLAYRSGTEAPPRATWFDYHGNVISVEMDANAPALSLDQQYAAFDRTIEDERDVWFMDLKRRNLIPLTRHPGADGFPVWSPDSSQIAFHSQRNGTFDIYVKPISGASAEAALVATSANEWPLDWSTDGRFLLYQRCDENYVSSDLLALPMTGTDKTPIVIAGSEFEERTGSFSPDTRWVAYETDQSGRAEVVIRAFPPKGGVISVSTDGGSTPRWDPDGKEIYFIAPDGKMMSAAVNTTGSTPTVGQPVVLFSTYIAPQTFTFQYAVSRDRTFLVNNRRVEQASASPITLILNWKP